MISIFVYTIDFFVVNADTTCQWITNPCSSLQQVFWNVQAFGLQCNLVSGFTAELRTSIQHLHCLLRSFVVTIHFFNQGFQHVKVELIKHAGDTANSLNVFFGYEVILAVLNNEIIVQAFIVHHVVDTTWTVTHVLIHTPLVVAGQYKQLLARVNTVQQSQHFFLVIVVVDLFELVKQDHGRLLNHLHEAVEVLTAPRLIDNNSRDTLCLCFQRKHLSQQCFATAFFTSEHYTS